MYSKDLQHKASKGSVQIKVSNGRLQLVFSHAGKRHYLSLGLPDNKVNRKATEAKAKLIESDIAYDRLDPTLAKYKPQSALSTVTPFFTPIPTPERSLDDLWEHYTEFKKPQVSPSTFKLDYRKYRNHIANLPTQSLDNALQIRDHLVAKLSPNAAKRTLTNISACCNWAVDSGLVTVNPFAGMAEKVKLPKSEYEESDINPFSSKERDVIIEAFENSKYYAYYAPYVKFGFFTGCRPSEAIALQWKHIDDRFITFEQAVVAGGKGLVLKDGLKTQRKRKFPINDQVRQILASVRPQTHNPNEFIFKSKEGGFIDTGDFLNHAWKGYKNRHGRMIEGIVTQLVKEGKVSEYRKPYQTRHTFITLCLEADIDAKDVGRWVGNSPEIIYRHYAGNKRDLQVPDL